MDQPPAASVLEHFRGVREFAQDPCDEVPGGRMFLGEIDERAKRREPYGLPN